MTTVNPSREAYQFAAEPRPVQSRSRYRGPEEIRLSDLEDIQNDPRVRNNIPQNSRSMKTKSSKKSINTLGRANQQIMKEEEPEEDNYAALTDRTIQDEKKLIPDYYVDRPPTPEYKPLEPGVDVGTQINDLELFDFILEVEPILQVLVGKTLEQSQTELREEDEKIEEMRHKARFEKKRNAELMVTQRKEALHIRKQEERQRREKQHLIEKEEKKIVHQKLIARLLAKHVTFNISGPSIKILYAQKALGAQFDTELRRELIPILLLNIVDGVRGLEITQRGIEDMAKRIESYHSMNHAAAVKVEFDRRKKIVDDNEAERVRKETEQRKRRERRRKLRLFVAKEALLETVHTSIVSKSIEVENPFAAEITDIFPTGKESIATIGGLLGELWLILDTLQMEDPQNIEQEQLINIFITLLMEKIKSRDFNVYISAQHQDLIQETLNQMNNNLITFNQNKNQIIEELLGKLGKVNSLQNLGVLHEKNLLNNSLFKQLNKALLHMFFTSIDYKIPEKKVEEQPQEVQPETAEMKADDDQNLNSHEDPHEENAKEGDQNEPPKENEAQPIEVQEPITKKEEEFKIPEITDLERLIIEAKQKIKLQFVPDWEFRKDCDAIVRFRIPLNREVKEIPNEEGKEGEEDGDEDEGQAREEHQGSHKDKEKKNNESTLKVEEILQEEDPIEKLKRLVLNDEFIEPFDGSTFEKEKIDFTEQVILRETPLKIYNPSLLEGKYIAQINERGQDELRKELISLIKENIPAWKAAFDENILAKAYVKYKKNEKLVMSNMIADQEKIPIFDIENV